MNDNEIIKALECCDNCFCDECCYKFKLLVCREELCKDALDLINRQKAEIESMGKGNERLRNSLMGECMLTSCKIKAELQSAAIKEFAERLKEKQNIDNLSLDGKYHVYVEDIDELVKEMTEGKE